MVTATETPNTVQYQGKQAPVCPLETVDFSRLVSQEPEEVEKFHRCCKTHGFFYLNLQGLDGRRILGDEQQLLQVMRNFFDQPDETKMNLAIPCNRMVGNHAGVKENSKDGYEILYVSRDELSSGPPSLPAVLKDDTKLFEAFVAGSNIITKTMLACLSNALDLKGADRFENWHRNDYKSYSTLAMFRYIHQKHTDIGSLTLLFSEQWGLQVVPMDVLKNRYSIAYFLRPESDKVFKDSEGRWLKASQWHDEKYEVFKRTHSKQPANTILTGGME